MTPERRRTPRAAISVLRARIVPLAFLLLSAAAIIIAVRETSQPAAIPASADPVADSQGIKIVVLPFESIGSDAYLAAGISDEITTRLSSIGSVSVIARNTASRYANTSKSIATIGRELTVDYVVEGSVRWERAAKRQRMRITPRIIRVRDNRQLWAGRAERVGEAAAQIAKEFGVHLDATEPTTNFAAFDAYLRGLDATRRSYAEEDSRNAVRGFTRATQLDPKFTAAWARLAIAHVYLFFSGYDRAQTRLALAQAALERAVALEPDAPLVHMASGYFHYWGFLDYPRASSEFALAWRQLPNDSEVIQALAFVRRRQGDLEQAAQDLKDAEALDPQNIRLLLGIGQTYLALRRYDEANATFERVMQLAPDSPLGFAGRAESEWLGRGSLVASGAVLDEMPRRDDEVSVGFRYRQALYRRDYDTALRVLTKSHVDDFLLLHTEQGFTPKDLLFGEVYALRGDAAASRRAYASARAKLERLVAAHGDDARLRSALAIALAGVGEKARAIEEATKATELLPVSRDALSGPERVADLVRVYAKVGESAAAVERLRYLLSIPSLVSPSSIHLDPTLDSIKSEFAR